MKKKSTRRKGNEFQNWCEKWIKDHHPDASIHNQKTAAKLIKVRDKKTGELKDVWVSQRNDIFGCIDLIVILPFHKPVYIQATEHSAVTKREKEMQKVPWNFNFCKVELWQKKKPGEIHIKKLTDDGLKDCGKIIRGKFYRLEG